MTMTPYDILILTETWLKNDVSSNELFEPNIFNVYRKDRDLAATDTSRGGGVLIAAKKHLLIETIDPYSLNSGFDEIRHIDILIARVRLVYKSVFVIVLYIPPSAVVDDYARLFECLSSINQLFSANLIVIGDINIFQFYSFSKMGGPSNNAINACINFAEFFNLTQWNGVLNRDNRLLDLVFSNFHCFVSKPVELLTLTNYSALT